MDYSKFYSLDAFNFMRSPVRDIFKAVDLSSIHSFAGGYPSADTFPLEKIEELTTTVVEKYGAPIRPYPGHSGTSKSDFGAI